MGLILILYNLGLILGLILSTPLWLAYLLLVPKTRAGFWEKLGFWPQRLKDQIAALPTEKKRLWFHAVSVGEFNAIKSLVPDLRDEYQIFISTTTLTGHTLAEKTFPDLPVLYFPFDLRPSVWKAVSRIRPDLVVLTETELWPNFIEQVSRQKPIILINGRLSKHSFRGYRWIKLLMKPCLRRMTQFFMQSQADADRITQLGDLPPEQLTVVGNLKFDLIPLLDEGKRALLGRLLNVHPDDTILTCASTHSGEDEFLIETYLQLKKDFPELKLILAPRHPERMPEIKGILNAKAVSYAVRSTLSEDNLNRQDIVVLDSIGELMTVYSFSKVAVMGGSFIERGGQNPLEPLSQGVPVVFGPYMDNFPEISRMILEAGAGFQAQDRAELINAVTSLLTQPEIYDQVAETGLQLIESNRGAKELICKAIRGYLS